MFGMPVFAHVAAQSYLFVGWQLCVGQETPFGCFVKLIANEFVVYVGGMNPLADGSWV